MELDGRMGEYGLSDSSLDNAFVGTRKTVCMTVSRSHLNWGKTLCLLNARVAGSERLNWGFSLVEDGIVETGEETDRRIAK